MKTHGEDRLVKASRAARKASLFWHFFPWTRKNRDRTNNRETLLFFPNQQDCHCIFTVCFPACWFILISFSSGKMFAKKKKKTPIKRAKVILASKQKNKHSCTFLSGPTSSRDQFVLHCCFWNERMCNCDHQHDDALPDKGNFSQPFLFWLYFFIFINETTFTYKQFEITRFHVSSLRKN